MTELPPLSLAEWIVLALLDEQPRHGFAVASLTGPDGAIGRAWQVPRPIVYRAAARLIELGLVEVVGTESGDRGPQRSVLKATRPGTAAVKSWLLQPVAHVRDARSELLAKLALLDRRDRPANGAATLIAAQRVRFGPIQQALATQQDAAEGFGRVLASWRLENIRSAVRFLDEVEKLL